MALFELTIALGLLLGMAGTAAKQAKASEPLVNSDRTVTFTYRDPAAKKVQLALEGTDAVDMTKGAGGIWSYTTLPLAPDIYGYTYISDGEGRMDINNPAFKPNLIWQSNMVLVPGNPPEPWEDQAIPHGVLHHHFYHSEVIGDNRDYFVYTPPGYRAGKKLPVLYLLHGYSDMASGWSEVGKANFIIDSLIAEGKVKPMLVVMTLGYGVPNFAKPNGPGFGNRGTVTQNYELFKRSLFTEVMPAVERDYSASADRKGRAIAGLSMGGAESLTIGLNSPGMFGYIGAFSSGGMSADFDSDFPKAKEVLGGRSKPLLWISCGTDDGLITLNRNLVKWLQGQKLRFDAHETPGRHTWMVWRRNLIDFSQLLFK